MSYFKEKDKVMRHKLLASAIFSLSLPISAQSAPSVSVDIAPLHSLVSQVMEGVAKPDLLIPAEASPHQYTLRPSQAKALSDAKVVFWMGESLTPWLEKAMANIAGSAQKIEMLDLDGTISYEFREGATFESHKDEEHKEEGHHDGEHDAHKEKTHHDEHDYHEEAHHDEHDAHKEDIHHDEHDAHKEDIHHGKHAHHGKDPHAWLDPENAKFWINKIKNILSKQDPANASAYSRNAAQATAKLDKLIQSTGISIDALGELRFIVFHDAYQYFEKRFNISAAGAISLGDAEDPSPARIKEIRDTVKKLAVTCVFSEPQFNPGLVKSVFEGTNVSTIAVMDPLGAGIATGSGHYQTLIKEMVNSFTKCK